MNTDAALASPPEVVRNILQRLNGEEQATLISYIAQLHTDATTQKLRRKWILGCIEYLPEGPSGFWNALSEEERNDEEIVHKLLEYTHRHKLFHYDPWSERLLPEQRIMPHQFYNDPDAFLAFVRSSGFIRWGEQNMAHTMFLSSSVTILK